MSRRLVGSAFAVALSAVGCGGSAMPLPPPPDLVAKAALDTRQAVGECEPAPAAKGRWKHRFSSRATAHLGSPRHGASDSLAISGGHAPIAARFAYGKTHKDLDDETVSVWLADSRCQWRELGAATTDEDGVASFELGADALAQPGTLVFEMVVGGDLSRARGYVWIVAPNARVVIFDVDGTLTTGDDQLRGELLRGRTPNEAPGASRLVRHYADASVTPIYLTGRPMALEARSRAWLDELGFPSGPLVLTRRGRDGVFHVEAFKLAQLARFRDTLELEIVAAYGNAKTDVCAYAKAGIPSERTFIIGKHGATPCPGHDAPAVVTDFGQHLDALSAETSQP